MVRIFGKVLLIVILGGLGGIFFERTLVPWLAEREPFSRIPSLTIERTTIVNPKQEIIINEAQALEVATRAVYPTLVVVERLATDGTILDAASGVVLTSDGVVITTDEILRPEAAYRILRERDNVSAEVVADDPLLGVLMLRADVSGWPVADFAESRDLALGKRLFLLAGFDDPKYETLVAELQEGAITKVEGEVGPEVSGDLLGEHVGAPVFTIEGRLMGLVGVEELVSAESIRQFFNETDLGR